MAEWWVGYPYLPDIHISIRIALSSHTIKERVEIGAERRSIPAAPKGSLRQTVKRDIPTASKLVIQEPFSTIKVYGNEMGIDWGRFGDCPSLNEPRPKSGIEGDEDSNLGRKNTGLGRRRDCVNHASFSLSQLEASSRNLASWPSFILASNLMPCVSCALRPHSII